MSPEFRETIYGDFAADFIEDTLANLCLPSSGIQTGPFGSQLHQEDYVAFGTPIITVEHLGENRIIHRDLPSVSDDDKRRLSKYTLQKGDIVFSRVGSVDRRALVRDDEEGWLFSGRCLRIRPDPERIDSNYLSYFFGLPSFKQHIRAIAVGATMPSLNTKILSDVLVPHPHALSEQRVVAKVLSSLDDRIDHNRALAANLEAIARRLFKSWFVDFDPVRAKAAGEKPSGLADDIAALFPDRFVESELGEIPEGWKCGRLFDIADLVYGKALKASDRTDGSIPVYGSGGITGWHNNALLNHPTIIVGRKGSVGILYREDRPSFPIDTVFYVKPVGMPLSFTYFSMERMGLEKLNTDAAVPGLNRDNAYRQEVILPSEAVVHAWHQVITPALAKQSQLRDESITLTKIRDILLPRLISGKLRVEDAESKIEEAIA